MDGSFYERQADDVGYFRVMKVENDRVPAHFHHSTEIVAVTAGREKIIINGAERILSRGEFSVSNSFDVHYYDYVEHSEVTILMLGEEYTAHFHETFEGDLPNFLPASGRSEELLRLLDVLAGLEGANPLVVKGYVDVFLGSLRDAYPLETPKKRGSGPLAAEILRFVEDHLKEPLSLRSLADRFGYHPNYFSALFRRYTGMGVKDYVNRLRAGRAARLSENGMKVDEIMRLVGFESPNTYYRAKKKWNKS